jgi:hypothetical protein
VAGYPPMQLGLSRKESRGKETLRMEDIGGTAGHQPAPKPCLQLATPSSPGARTCGPRRYRKARLSCQSAASCARPPRAAAGARRRAAGLAASRQLRPALLTGRPRVARLRRDKVLPPAGGLRCAARFHELPRSSARCRGWFVPSRRVADSPCCCAPARAGSSKLAINRLGHLLLKARLAARQHRATAKTPSSLQPGRESKRATKRLTSACRPRRQRERQLVASRAASRCRRPAAEPPQSALRA